MTREFRIHPHADNPKVSVLTEIWKKSGQSFRFQSDGVQLKSEVRILISELDKDEAPYWVKAQVRNVITEDGGIYFIICSQLLNEATGEKVGPTTFFYLCKYTKGYGAIITRG